MNLATKRFVGCMDILGFKAALCRLGTSSLATLYEEAINLTRHSHKATAELHVPWVPHAVGETQPFKEIEHVAVFSDTIIVFTENDSEDSLYTICHFTNTVFKLFLFKRLPLRGAIAHGDVILKPSQSLFVGEGIVTAHELEQSIDALGIVLSPKIVEPLNSWTVHEFDVAQNKTSGTKRLRVPISGFNLALPAGDNWPSIFRELRDQAGEKHAQRYHNSEEIVAAMMAIEPQLLNES